MEQSPQGWGAPPGSPSPSNPLPGGPSPGSHYDPQTIEQGKTWAFLSYASFFVGLPVWIVPLVQRDNAFALYHAKQAGASYLLGVAAAMVVATITLITCGLGVVLTPLVFFPLITAVHGLLIVNAGEVREPMLVFGLGDKLFASIEPKPPGQP